MPIRQRLVTFGIPTAAAATIALAAGLTPWARPAVVIGVDPVPAPSHQVDVVFAVDTTGSMGGLIEGAKRTVWSIATHIRKTDPRAELRIGLVAYRDIGDDYVTRDFALTGDLDAVFAELSSYQAAGGGDPPEDVGAAIDDTLHRMQWREDAKKLVFLVGDAPPAERGDVAPFEVLAREAADHQITINTIRCGLDPDTGRAWQRIATLAHGDFSSVEQGGGVQQIATPYDDKLAELSARIDQTAVIMGEGARTRHQGQMAVAAGAAAPAKADRAAYYATKGGARAEHDVVTGYADGTLDLGSVKPEELPESLRGLDPAALHAQLAQRAADREAAQHELIRLTEQRADYLLKAREAGGPGGFDDKVKASVEKQLK